MVSQRSLLVSSRSICAASFAAPDPLRRTRLAASRSDSPGRLRKRRHRYRSTSRSVGRGLLVVCAITTPQSNRPLTARFYWNDVFVVGVRCLALDRPIPGPVDVVKHRRDQGPRGPQNRLSALVVGAHLQAERLAELGDELALLAVRLLRQEPLELDGDGSR